jgi:hypothetical protein
MRYILLLVFIAGFPATFLLNQKGERIERGIIPEQLKEFLPMNL